jgi:hypothetical protein
MVGLALFDDQAARHHEKPVTKLCRHAQILGGEHPSEGHLLL